MFFADRCQFCNFPVNYNDEDTETICPACGEKMWISSFRREQEKPRSAMQDPLSDEKSDKP